MDCSEGDQLNIPVDILKEFQSMKSATNLNAGDFMKTLLSAFRRDATTPTYENNRKDDSGLSPLSQSPVTFAVQPKMRQKTVPGQKLNRVCEILQVKRAAKQQLITSFHGEAGNDILMSRHETMTSLNEAMTSPSVTLPSLGDTMTLHNEAMTSPNERMTTSNPMLTSNNPMMTSHSDITSQGEEALDLSVKKVDEPEQPSLPSQHDLNDSPFGGELYVDLVENNVPVTSSWASVKTESVPPELSWGFTGQHSATILDESSTPKSKRVEIIQRVVPSHDEVKNFLRNAMDRKREAAKPPVKRQTSRPKKSAQKQEGMRLVNENILFPGVYTGTYKLPGCRRGGRKHSIKPKQVDPNIKDETKSKKETIVAKILTPPAAKDSEMVEMHKKRGRPFRTPGEIHDGAGNMTKYMKIEAATQPTPVIVQQPFHPATPETHVSLSTISQTATNQIPLTSQCGTLTFMLSSPPNLTQYQGGILPQQCFVTLPTNQGLMSQVNLIPMQLLSREAIQMKNIHAQDTEQDANSVTSPASTIAVPMMNLDFNIKKETLSPGSSSATIHQYIINPPGEIPDDDDDDVKPIVNLVNTKENKNKNELPAHLAQMEVEKHQEEMRVRTMKTDLVRSDSNFYCCSFKLQPQRPEVRKGGAPAKRSRGRPKSLGDDQKTTDISEICEDLTEELYRELFHCKLCNQVMSSSDKMAHQLGHQQKPVDPKSTCSTCGVSFQPAVVMSSEDLNGENDRVYCEQCAEMFSRETNKAKILESRLSPPSKITCDKCGQVFAQQTSLLDHRKLIHNETSQYFVCEMCDKILYSRATFRYHLLSHAPDSKSARSSIRGCQKTCRNDADVRRHVHAHNHLCKDYQCDYANCRKRFQKNFHLQEHIRVKHLKIKPFSCCWSGCTKQFSGVRHLKVHMLIHNDEKPLRCEYCEYRCRQRNALNWHMRKHPEVPYHYQTKRKTWRPSRLRYSRDWKRHTDRKTTLI